MVTSSGILGRRRRTIVVVDDYTSMLDVHKSILTDQFGDRFEYRLFDTSTKASEFIKQHSGEIIGYIQDIRRSDNINDVGGIVFFNSVIDEFTPWAKCLFVSAAVMQFAAVGFHSTVYQRIRCFSKMDLFLDDQAFRKELEWLITPIDKISDLEVDTETRSVIDAVAPAWKQLSRHILSHPDYLDTMSSLDFELLAGDIFQSFGWEIELTSRTRDGGYDIIAIRKVQPTNLRILVEAKRYARRRTVGVDIVRSLYGVKQARAASQLVLVTSSFVSADAKKEFARVVPWELDFFERDKILEWCRDQSSVQVLGNLEKKK
jgi:hypothetical protein